MLLSLCPSIPVRLLALLSSTLALLAVGCLDSARAQDFYNPVPAASSPAAIECNPQTFDVIMASPVSSALSRNSEEIRAVIAHSMLIGHGIRIPEGTHLDGRVVQKQVGTKKTAGRVKIRFFVDHELARFRAVPHIEGEWLTQAHADTDIWALDRKRNTHRLQTRLKRRLGGDPSVWNQVLGINSNARVNVHSEEFMTKFHKHDVLVGAGDRLTLRLVCP